MILAWPWNREATAPLHSCIRVCGNKLTQPTCAHMTAHPFTYCGRCCRNMWHWDCECVLFGPCKHAGSCVLTCCSEAKALEMGFGLWQRCLLFPLQKGIWYEWASLFMLGGESSLCEGIWVPCVLIHEWWQEGTCDWWVFWLGEWSVETRGLLVNLSFWSYPVVMKCGWLVKEQGCKLKQPKWDVPTGLLVSLSVIGWEVWGTRGTWRDQNREAVLSDWEEWIEVVWASSKDGAWVSPEGAVVGISYWTKI